MENETKKNKKTTKTTSTKKTVDKKVATKTTKSATKTTKKVATKPATKATKKTTVKVAKEVKAPKKEAVKEVKEVVTKPVKEEKVVKKTTPEKKVRIENIKKFFRSDLGSLIEILAVIIVIILAFFLITNIIKNNGTKQQTSNKDVQIQYEEIFMSNIFNQSEDDYYVLMYDTEDTYASAIENYKKAYTAKEDAISFHTVLLNSAFNKKFVAKESNVVNNIKEFKVSGITLIRVEDKTITEKYEGTDAVLNKLGNM